MSDSDDFSDAGEEFPNEVNTVNNHVRRVNKNGVKVRGCDKDWVCTTFRYKKLRKVESKMFPDPRSELFAFTNFEMI